MPRKTAQKNRTAAAEVLQQIRGGQLRALAEIYHCEVEHDDGLFDHLGFASHPSLEEFRARYLNCDAVEFDRLIADVWSYEPTAERWRAKNDAAGVTMDVYLTRLLHMIRQFEAMEPHPPELQQLYSIRQRFMAQNAIQQH